jgi:phosphate starvation-inducible PhoH-like protein
LKNNTLHNSSKISSRQHQSSTTINVGNSEVLEIFGVNNINLDFFESNLPIKIYQKGNQLNLKGEKKYINILKNAILKTINQLKIKKTNNQINLMQENLTMQIISEKEKIKNINITKTNKLDVVGKSKMQNTYLEILQEKKIIFAIGPAGTGKTFLAVAAAVSQLLENKFDRIILSRPAVEAGEKLGFLPGDLKDKVDPYLRPLYDSLYDLMTADIATKKIESSEIEIAPLAFMRGRTLNNSFVILDEAQNATHNQIKMFLTRCGKHSRMVVTGDPSQTDLSKRSDSGLLRSIKILQDIDGVSVINFSQKDIVRDEMVTRIINAYDSYDEQIKDLFDQKNQINDPNKLQS